ncbi:hypothetical protein SAMN06265222_10777 [Neorhodopirellula lusitana]|uniref:Uncharacterized protein n=1 Tax=Neorhodopirellula lusitana TaxID=445327 RepID=A0ABY1Q6K3_9BACT|nr:hypothetical protein SAMN06265222_10777 [Neorhodopirellula lusitana]
MKKPGCLAGRQPGLVVDRDSSNSLTASMKHFASVRLIAEILISRNRFGLIRFRVVGPNPQSELDIQVASVRFRTDPSVPSGLLNHPQSNIN